MLADDDAVITDLSNPDEEVLNLPDGLDLAEFPIVDISLEQFDGDPTHSGDTIIRGILST